MASTSRFTSEQEARAAKVPYLVRVCEMAEATASRAERMTAEQWERLAEIASAIRVREGGLRIDPPSDVTRRLVVATLRDHEAVRAQERARLAIVTALPRARWCDGCDVRNVSTWGAHVVQGDIEIMVVCQWCRDDLLETGGVYLGAARPGCGNCDRERCRCCSVCGAAPDGECDRETHQEWSAS